MEKMPWCAPFDCNKKAIFNIIFKFLPTVYFNTQFLRTIKLKVGDKITMVLSFRNTETWYSHSLLLRVEKIDERIRMMFQYAIASFVLDPVITNI